MRLTNEKIRIAVISSLATLAVLTTSGRAWACEYSKDELEYYTSMLSHLIAGEVEGCNRQMKEYVGSVVLNRTKSNKFPDSIEGVIFQEGQYACTWDGNFNKTPNDEDIEVAKDLLENGSKLPDNVIFQAEFTQGSGTYTSLVAPNGVTMYFCYG